LNDAVFCTANLINKLVISCLFEEYAGQSHVLQLLKIETIINRIDSFM